jgi:hypothetical protein
VRRRAVAFVPIARIVAKRWAEELSFVVDVSAVDVTNFKEHRLKSCVIVIDNDSVFLSVVLPIFRLVFLYVLQFVYPFGFLISHQIVIITGSVIKYQDVSLDNGFLEWNTYRVPMV